MQSLKEYKTLLESAIEEISSYELRPTKASSARIRKLSNQIGKDGKFLRKDLIEADKGK